MNTKIKAASAAFNSSALGEQPDVIRHIKGVHAIKLLNESSSHILHLLHGGGADHALGKLIKTHVCADLQSLTPGPIKPLVFTWAKPSRMSATSLGSSLSSPLRKA